jgi:hypothetical protein
MGKFVEEAAMYPQIPYITTIFLSALDFMKSQIAKASRTQVDGLQAGFLMDVKCEVNHTSAILLKFLFSKFS